MVSFSRSRRPASTAGTEPADDVEAQVSAPSTPSGDTSADTSEERDDRPDVMDDAPLHQPATGTVRILLLLARTAHLRLGLITTAGVTLGAVASGREPREIAVVAATVLTGQAVLGWHNDLVDRHRDRQHGVAGKPLADGRLLAGTVWFAVACGVLLLVPLSVTNGVDAATAYLVSVLVGILGNVVLRTGPLSFLTWAVSFALLPAFLSYGGWGGQFEGDPPRVVMVALAAALGVGVHVLASLWGLEPEDAAGWRSLPLRLGRRLGSSRLLLLALVYVAAVLVALVAAGAAGGLTR